LTTNKQTKFHENRGFGGKDGAFSAGLLLNAAGVEGN